MTALRAMILDDSVVIRRALASVLGRQGVQVVFAGDDARQALAAIDEHRPDVLFLDIIMPRQDGLTTLEQVRGRHPHLKIVMLTSLSDSGTALEARRLRADHYVVKPFDPEVIQRTLARLFEQSAS